MSINSDARKTTSVVRETVRIAASVIIVSLLALAMVSIVQRLAGTSFPLLVVKTGSMEPAIRVGDVIVITAVDSRDIYAAPGTGDVIVFYTPRYEGREDHIIVHRAVQRNQGGFTTKGDANSVVDSWSPVPDRNILGRWTGIKIPYWTGLGFLSLFLRGEYDPQISYLLGFQARWGTLAIVAIVGLNVLTIARDVTRRVRERRDESGTSSQET